MRCPPRGTTPSLSTIETSSPGQASPIRRRPGVAMPVGPGDYVRDLAQKLTQSSGDEVSVYGIEDAGWVGVWPLYWGADWVDEKGDFTVASPETVRAVEFMVDFYRSGYRGGNVMQGTAAMTNGMSWTVNSYVASGLDLAFAPTPIGDRHVTETWTDGAAILRSSQNKEAAWKFLEWLFQPDNAVGFYTQQWNYLVPMRGIREIWEEHMRSRLGESSSPIITPPSSSRPGRTAR